MARAHPKYKALRLYFCAWQAATLSYIRAQARRKGELPWRS